MQTPATTTTCRLSRKSASYLTKDLDDDLRKKSLNWIVLHVLPDLGICYLMANLCSESLPVQLVNCHGGVLSAGCAHVAWDGLHSLVVVLSKSKLLLQLGIPAYLLASSDVFSNS